MLFFWKKKLKLVNNYTRFIEKDTSVLFNPPENTSKVIIDVEFGV